MTEENHETQENNESSPSVEVKPEPVTHHKKDDGEGATLTFKKSTLWKVGTFLFAALFLLSFFNGGGLGVGTGTGNNVAPTDGGTVPSPSGSVKVSITDADPLLGDKNAGITIVEFSDFECPFCGRAYTGALTDFKNSDYFKDGDVNLVYKHLPLTSIHREAQKSAEASECANRQGKFWEYHDLLFQGGASGLNRDNYGAYASQVGLDMGDFDSCLDNGEAAAKIQKDLGEATAAGGRGTPYFVLVNEDGDTQTVSGAVPWANFEAAISALQ